MARSSKKIRDNISRLNCPCGQCARSGVEATFPASRVLNGGRMTGLEGLIRDLSKRAAVSDVRALLATSREGRLYNAALARELRSVVEALKCEMHRRHASVLRQSNNVQVRSPRH